MFLQLTLMVSGNETAKTKEYDSQNYIAAVVEYNPNLGLNPLQSIQNNLPIFEDIIHHASQYVSVPVLVIIFTNILSSFIHNMYLLLIFIFLSDTIVFF